MSTVCPVLVGTDDIEENQTSKVSVKGLRRKTVNKNINEQDNFRPLLGGR